MCFVKSIATIATYWATLFGSYGDTAWVDSANYTVYYSMDNTPASVELRLKQDPMLIFYDFVKVRRVRRRQKKYEVVR